MRPDAATPEPCVAVITTCPDAATADRIAAGLIADRLAACVQAWPITSRYRWEGAVQRDDEILLLIKTRQCCFPGIAAFVKAHHPYTCPELVALPIVEAAAAYLDWIAAACRP